jgi:hypothetical protein
MACFERLDGIGYHSIKPAKLIAAGDFKEGAVAEIVDGGGLGKGGELGRGSGKGLRSESALKRHELERGMAGAQVRGEGRLDGWRLRCCYGLGSVAHGEGSLKNYSLA